MKKLTRRKYMIKMDLKETDYEDLKWVELAHDKDQWRAFVNKVINFGLLTRRID